MSIDTEALGWGPTVTSVHLFFIWIIPVFIYNPRMRAKHILTGFAIVLTLVTAVVGTRLVNHGQRAITEEPHRTMGPADAPVTIVEFSDFACPYCAYVAPVIKRILQKYPQDVRLVYKHFPLNMHRPYALWAAEAAECAGDQGKFWEYHDLLYAEQKTWVPKDPKQPESAKVHLREYAKSLGLDAARFGACLDSGGKEKFVTADKQQGKNFQVSGTPTLILNFRRLIANMDEKRLDKAITDEIKRAKK